MKNVKLLSKIEELEKKVLPIVGKEKFHMLLSNILLESFEKSSSVTMDEVINLIQLHIDIADKNAA